jgi:hypothetical protein
LFFSPIGPSHPDCEYTVGKVKYPLARSEIAYTAHQLVPRPGNVQELVEIAKHKAVIRPIGMRIGKEEKGSIPGLDMLPFDRVLSSSHQDLSIVPYV